MPAQVKLQVRCKTKYISESMLLVYSCVLYHSPVEIRVLLRTVVTTAAAEGKCCVQTQGIIALSAGWQVNRLSSFQMRDGSALEPHSALNPTSPANYAYLCPVA